MFVRFRETLGKNNARPVSFPPRVIEELDKGLPQGTRYYALEDDVLCLGPDENGEFSFGGLLPVVTLDMRKALGDNPSAADVLNYSYNAQKPIHMKLSNPNCIVVNGQEVPVDRFVLSPTHEIRLDKGSFIAFPAAFPPPFDVMLSANGGKDEMALRIRRVPNESADTLRFESDAELPLAVKYTVVEPVEEGQGASVSFSISVQPSRCSSLEEAVNVLAILKSISDGTCTLAGIPLGQPDSESNLKGADEEVFLWLKRALAIESALGLRFDPVEIVLSGDSARVIAEIYGGLVLGIPVRTPINDASIELNESAVPKIEETLRSHGGHYLALSYSRPCSFELFGESIELQSLCGVFDLVAAGIEKDESGAKTLMLERAPSSLGGYLSRLLFRDEADLDAYYEEMSMEVIMQRLQQAETPDDILKREP